MQEIRFRSLGWEDPLEEEMATHSSILAWRIEPSRVHGVTESDMVGQNSQQRAEAGLGNYVSTQPTPTPGAWHCFSTLLVILGS